MNIIAKNLMGGGGKLSVNAAYANFSALYAIPYDRSQTVCGLSFCIFRTGVSSSAISIHRQTICAKWHEKL